MSTMYNNTRLSLLAAFAFHLGQDYWSLGDDFLKVPVILQIQSHTLKSKAKENSRSLLTRTLKGN